MTMQKSNGLMRSWRIRPPLVSGVFKQRCTYDPSLVLGTWERNARNSTEHCDPSFKFPSPAVPTTCSIDNSWISVGFDFQSASSGILPSLFRDFCRAKSHGCVVDIRSMIKYDERYSQN